MTPPSSLQEAADRAAACCRMQQFDEAEHLFRMVLQVLPDHGMLRHNLAAVLRAQGRDAEAAAITRGESPAIPAPARTRPTWAIVPGLLRNIPHLVEILNNLLTFRREGLIDGIVLSTWKGQVSGNRDIATDLDRVGVRWIESDEPKIPCGNNLHQMKAVMMALEACPADAFVLKLRTDRLNLSSSDNQTTIRRVLNHELDLEIGNEPGDEWPFVFEKRIAVGDAELLRFFNFPDQVFFGTRNDLLQLINFDLRYYEFFTSLRPESWWFSRPFIDRFRIFQTYYRIFPGLSRDPRMVKRMLPVILNNDFFIDALVSYILVIRKYYRIGYLNKNDLIYWQARQALAQVTYADWFLRVLPPFGFRDFQGLCTTTTFVNDAWIAPFLDGGLKMDWIGERILAACERVSKPDFHRNHYTYLESKRDEVQALAETMRSHL